MTAKSIFIGVMSGTSLDGVDAVACRFFDGDMQVLGHSYRPYPQTLKDKLTATLAPGHNEIERAGALSLELATLYAQTINDLVSEGLFSVDEVRAAAVHGQTVRHCPQAGFTVQLNNPALVAELTGLDVIADLRSRDMAAGGQGAPLVPAFHAERFTGNVERAIVNIGGIANVTLLPALGSQAPVLGFDCGPGNTLLDVWTQRHCGQSFDRDAAFAQKGVVVEKLLNVLMADEYFVRPAPKSTGREYFNEAWLLNRFPALSTLKPEDVQRTLVEVSVAGIIRAVKQTAPETQELYVCGGGVFNPLIMQSLSQSGLTVQSTSVLGLDPMLVEAAAFAWLGYRFINKKAGNLPAVTHASGLRILGALYPA